MKLNEIVDFTSFMSHLYLTAEKNFLNLNATLTSDHNRNLNQGPITAVNASPEFILETAIAQL